MNVHDKKMQFQEQEQAASESLTKQHYVKATFEINDIFTSWCKLGDEAEMIPHWVMLLHDDNPSMCLADEKEAAFYQTDRKSPLIPAAFDPSLKDNDPHSASLLIY